MQLSRSLILEAILYRAAGPYIWHERDVAVQPGYVSNWGNCGSVVLAMNLPGDDLNGDRVALHSTRRRQGLSVGSPASSKSHIS